MAVKESVFINELRGRRSQVSCYLLNEAQVGHNRNGQPQPKDDEEIAI
jgi:hypothetical protein